MRDKTIMLFSLILAYLFMLAHAFIPHHHHETNKGAAIHHFQEQHSGHKHHDHQGHSHGGKQHRHLSNETPQHSNEKQGPEQNHSTHFIHSLDFENVILEQFFSLPDFSKTTSLIQFIGVDPFKLTFDFHSNPLLVPLKSPPPKGIQFIDSFSLRGPPSFSFC